MLLSYTSPIFLMRGRGARPAIGPSRPFPRRVAIIFLSVRRILQQLQSELHGIDAPLERHLVAFTVDMHHACTAQAHAAAKFGAGELELLANNPKQRRILRRILTAPPFTLKLIATRIPPELIRRFTDIQPCVIRWLTRQA
jgi:hypothetical protein